MSTFQQKICDIIATDVTRKGSVGGMKIVNDSKHSLISFLKHGATVTLCTFPLGDAAYYYYYYYYSIVHTSCPVVALELLE